MRSALKSSVSKLLQKLFRSLGMSSENKKMIPEPFTALNIVIYSALIQGQFLATGLAGMEGWCVVQLCLYKIGSISGHEYLSAKIRNQSGEIFYLAIERLLGEVEDKVTESSNDGATEAGRSETETARLSGSPEITTAPAQAEETVLKQGPANATLSSLHSASSPSLDSVNGKRPAKDHAYHLGPTGKYNPGDKLYRELVFDYSANDKHSILPLWHLVVLANTLHQQDRRYLLLSKNCYWYAGTIMKIIEEEYSPKVLKVQTTGSDHLDGDLRLPTTVKMKQQQRRAGKWHSIVIYDEEKVDTTYLREMYRQNMEEFKQPIQARDNELKAVDEARDQIQAKDNEIKTVKDEARDQIKTVKDEARDQIQAKDSELKAAKDQIKAAKDEAEAAKNEAEAAKNEAKAAKNEAKAAKAAEAERDEALARLAEFQRQSKRNQQQ